MYQSLAISNKSPILLTFLGVRKRLPETIPFPSVMNLTLIFTNCESNISGSSGTGTDILLPDDFLFGSGGLSGSGGGIFIIWLANTKLDDNRLCNFNLQEQI